MENHTAPSDPKDPAAFLSSIIGVPVTVKLNSGLVYKGELQSVDGYMNIALEKCAEYVNGQLRRNYGDAFVRGNNGECLPPLLGVFTAEDTWAKARGDRGIPNCGKARGKKADEISTYSAIYFERLSFRVNACDRTSTREETLGVCGCRVLGLGDAP